MSGEAASRARIDLPGRQAALAAAVLDAGRPVIVLLFSGRPLVMPEVFERAAAVLACWFPGSEAGHAVAALLTGAASPSAGLAVTWPRDVGQVPIAYSARSGGRPENPDDHYTSKYLDLPNSPQFPFGHGLGYTSFAVGEPRVAVGEGIEVEAPVSNTGARAGATTLFLFIRIRWRASPGRSWSSGGSRRSSSPRGRAGGSGSGSGGTIGFLDAALRPVVEPGRFEVHLGLSAEPAGLRSASFVLE